jgi:hypothetical protein
MDTEGGLLDVTKFSLLFAFREGAMFFDVEL